MITLEQAKYHLRVDGDHEDADIEAKLLMATAIVQNHIGPRARLTMYSPGVEDAATLLVLGELYANREATADPLSRSVRALLEQLRVPGIA